MPKLKAKPKFEKKKKGKSDNIKKVPASDLNICYEALLDINYKF